MVLTQTQIDGLQTQYTAMNTAAKANFLTAIAAAASPNDIVVAVKNVEDELDALDYLNDVINREQELVDASTDGSDSSNDSDSDDESGDTPADNEPIVGPGTTSPTDDPTPAETAAPTTTTGTAPTQTVATDPASTTPPGSNTTPPAA